MSILIVDDHPLYRSALATLLRALVGPDSAVLEANSAEEGLRLAERNADLQLVLLDSGLPGMRGSEATRSFRRAFPVATIIVISASEDRREAAAVLQAGAHAFVSKAVPTERIAAIVEQGLAGTLPAAQWITADGSVATGADAAVAITPRQREILVLLSRGLANKEIALHLGLAEVTVKLHVSQIFRALKVSNRTQAVLAARRLGVPGAGDPLAESV